MERRTNPATIIKWSTNILISSLLTIVILLVAPTIGSNSVSTTRNYDFHVKYQNYTRLCYTKPIVTVNGEFPGPTVTTREGDRLIIKVVNHLPDKNISIHWHGIRQLRTGWFDGPSYITQCPIQPGNSYNYNFTVIGQRGTLFWHAHLSWLRATVHGAIIILPKRGVPYPFNKPSKELPPIVLSEWWNSNTEEVIKQALNSGVAPNISNSFTINGQSGILQPCSSKDTTIFRVGANKTYLVRIVNAALNEELFFTIANHKMTVVEVDATYVKPIETYSLLITPGQTTNVLIRTDQPIGQYAIATRPYKSSIVAQIDNSSAIAILDYSLSPRKKTTKEKALILVLPIKKQLPLLNDTMFATTFTTSLRSLNSARFPTKVPMQIDRHLFFTIGLALKPNGKLGASINNISFVLPKVAILQSMFYSKKLKLDDVRVTSFIEDFPDNPPTPFNYTGPQPNNIQAKLGTKLSHIPFNSSVQLILQDTSILGIENHPIHLHGFNFYVVGQGFGNYNPLNCPATFNLMDPPQRNTIGVPTGGWVALRFLADNPGVWFMHCHLEVHTSLGLDMAFVVENGVGPEQSIIPPPPDLPAC